MSRRVKLWVSDCAEPSLLWANTFTEICWMELASDQLAENQLEPGFSETPLCFPDRDLTLGKYDHSVSQVITFGGR